MYKDCLNKSTCSKIDYCAPEEHPSQIYEKIFAQENIYEVQHDIHEKVNVAVCPPL
jgi:hypothetical protein